MAEITYAKLKQMVFDILDNGIWNKLVTKNIPIILEKKFKMSFSDRQEEIARIVKEFATREPSVDPDDESRKRRKISRDTDDDDDDDSTSSSDQELSFGENEEENSPPPPPESSRDEPNRKAPPAE